MPYQLRDYQQYCVDQIFEYFKAHKGNPIIALPTGTGKSLVLAETCRSIITRYPTTRIMVLTHVKELIEQNFKTTLRHWPTAPAGVYSAGLKRRDSHTQITFAGIQSVYNKAEEFGLVHLLFIDECHLVSQKDDTTYRTFINSLKAINPHLKVIGLSATPWRTKQGMLTDPGGIFTDVAVDCTSLEAFNWLIKQGWLVRLVPKKTVIELDVSGVRITAGEFNQSELQAAVDKYEITEAALDEALVRAKDREHWLVFASGVDHAEHVADALTVRGVEAAAIHSRMASSERDKRILDFREGRLRALVNNNILTTGFDVPQIDCIVMLRPTASPGLWVQMLGRGTRPLPFVMSHDSPDLRLDAIAKSEKPNCLVLDYAGNTARLGPINDPVIPRRKGRSVNGLAPVRLCDNCGCYSHAASRFCENCGAEFPRSVKINSEASVQQLIKDSKEELIIVDYKVDTVTYSLHEKAGKPTSLRVDYHCGPFQRFSEYVCLEHGGHATYKARGWWRYRCPWGIPPSTLEGYAAVDHLRTPKAVQVRLGGKYAQIIGYKFNDDSA
jgi:DNA repair protein RadD